MPDCSGNDMNNYACYPTLSPNTVDALLPDFCQTNAQCAGRHDSGRCFCGKPNALGCCHLPEQNKLPPFCGETDDNEAALILLDAICKLADTGHGGGYCDGNFNWGPGGQKENIISQDNTFADDLWPPQGSNVAYGLNCRVVSDAKNNKNTCQYNREAAANASGDIVYKRFGWNNQGVDYCAALPEADCNKIQKAFGLCAWTKAGVCSGDRANLSIEPSQIAVPVCLHEKPVYDCGEEPNGTYCVLFPDIAGQKSVGKCTETGCKPF